MSKCDSFHALSRPVASHWMLSWLPMALKSWRIRERITVISPLALIIVAFVGFSLVAGIVMRQRQREVGIF